MSWRIASRRRDYWPVKSERPTRRTAKRRSDAIDEQAAEPPDEQDVVPTTEAPAALPASAEDEPPITELDRSLMRAVRAFIDGPLTRVTGATRELPKSKEEWDIFLLIKRLGQEASAELSEETAENVATVLGRSHKGMATALIRRWSQRRAPVTEAGDTEISTKSERTKSRRSSNVA